MKWRVVVRSHTVVWQRTMPELWRFVYNKGHQRSLTWNYTWNLTLLKSPGNLHLTLQLHYTFHSTIENFSACCNPWKPTVFPRLARWQLKVFEREKSARNRKKAETTKTGKASIPLIHAKTEIDRNYFCFNLPLHLKTYPCWQATALRLLTVFLGGEN